MEGILADLTPPQLEAVTHLDGPMLVVAGAGSGKTRVVTRRIAFLIGQGIPAWRILALTFTNKAAREMRERVEKLVGGAPSWMGTFHSVCARMLRRDIQSLEDGRDGRFTILDRGEQESLVKAILKKLGQAGGENRPSSILARISRAKSGLVDPDRYQPSSWRDEAVAATYAEYERELRSQNALDFDDLLTLAVRLLERRPEILAKYQAYFPYALVDEYQDTNQAQYRLLRSLAGDRRNLHATGDPDQSIYSWRGADYRNIMDFRNDFPGAKMVRLEENYRSGRFILAAANQLIRHNRQRLAKDLFTRRPGGEKVRLASLQSDRMEAMWVGENIEILLAGGARAGEIAVFYRTNAQSRQMEEALVRRNIPYQLVGGVRFYERREVKDLLAHLRIRVNPRDLVSFRRVASSRPGIGGKTLEKLAESAAAAGLPVFSFLANPEFSRRPAGWSGKTIDFARWAAGLAAIAADRADRAVREILAHSGLLEALIASADKDEQADDRMDNLYGLAARADEFVRQRLAGATPPSGPDADREAASAINLDAFLEDVALVADVDGMAPDSSLITLMTLHSAKGLEFDDVFIAGLEEGLLPHRNAMTEEGEEEERRLFYVGITRARKRAWISRAACRSIFGSLEEQPPSRFLKELPDEALERIDHADPFSSEAGSGWRSGGDRADLGEGPDADSVFEADADFDPFPDAPPAPDIPEPSRAFGKREKPRPGRRARPGRGQTGAPVAAFRPGELVRHPLFGSGKLLAADSRRVMVQFFASGTRVFPRDLAQLTRE